MALAATGAPHARPLRPGPTVAAGLLLRDSPRSNTLSTGMGRERFAACSHLLAPIGAPPCETKAYSTQNLSARAYPESAGCRAGGAGLQLPHLPPWAAVAGVDTDRLPAGACSAQMSEICRQMHISWSGTAPRLSPRGSPLVSPRASASPAIDSRRRPSSNDHFTVFIPSALTRGPL
jgi:hypothetical protein